MSCVDITPEMRWLLDALRGSPRDEILEKVRATPEWEQAVKWGWVIPRTGELTGSGWRHAGDLPDGILSA